MMRRLSLLFDVLDRWRETRNINRRCIRSDTAHSRMGQCGACAEQKQAEHSEECNDPAKVLLPPSLHLPTSSSDP